MLLKNETLCDTNTVVVWEGESRDFYYLFFIMIISSKFTNFRFLIYIPMTTILHVVNRILFPISHSSLSIEMIEISLYIPYI